MLRPHPQAAPAGTDTRPWGHAAYPVPSLLPHTSALAGCGHAAAVVVHPGVATDGVLPHCQPQECEDGIPLEYLAGLDDCYKNFVALMQKNQTACMVVPWNSFGPGK